MASLKPLIEMYQPSRTLKQENNKNEEEKKEEEEEEEEVVNNNGSVNSKRAHTPWHLEKLQMPHGGT